MTQTSSTAQPSYVSLNAIAYLKTCLMASPHYPDKNHMCDEETLDYPKQVF